MLRPPPLNEIKASKLPGLDRGFRFATGAEIDAHFACKPGYLGPMGLKRPVKVVADRAVAAMSDFICGANEAGCHFTGVNWGRDVPEPDVVADIRDVVAGDPSPDGKGVLAIQRGIEVGHVFLLGSYYSEKMNANYLDEAGKPQLMQMGCYGIGVTRILGAAIEQNFDERGIVWPTAIAPFAVVICPIGYDRSADVRAAADQLHDQLQAAGIDVMLDDRGERPGAMFADWGTGRRAPPRRALRPRPQGRPGRVPGPARGAADRDRGRRPAVVAESQARRVNGELTCTGRARRRWAAMAAVGSLAGLLPGRSLAGAQIEEPLANAVRSALAAAVEDRAPPKPNFDTMGRAPGLPALARRG